MSSVLDGAPPAKSCKRSQPATTDGQRSSGPTYAPPFPKGAINLGSNATITNLTINIAGPSTSTSLKTAQKHQDDCASSARQAPL